MDSSDGRKSMSNNVEEDDEMINIVVDSMAEEIEKFQIQERIFQHEGPIICRIPNEIRAGHDTAYEPKIIAIGPYHRNNGGQEEEINSELLVMEEIKLRFLFELCKRDDENGAINKEGILKTYTTAVKEQELKARKKYSESSFKMSSEDFVKMLILDGCFIVEFLLKRAEGTGTVRTMPTPFKLRTMPALRRDLLLFENQIPFFILEEIYAKTNNKLTNTILDLALHYLHKGKITKEMLPKEYRWEVEPKEIHHFLHLSHLCLVSQLDLPKEAPQIRVETLSDKAMLKSKFCLLSIANFLLIIWEWSCWKCFGYTPPIPPETRKARTIPAATRLKEAGVHFKKKESDKGFLDVSFKDGNMEIPTVNIQENTSSEYRNVLALEQTCKDYGNKFTSYVVFMDNLIDTADDVALLKKSKIIESKLGCEEDVAKFFKEIRSGLIFNFDNHYLVSMFEDINEYSVDSVNRFLGKVDQWWEELKQKYFRNPWAFISLMAAFVLLGLTAAQTVYSVKSFQQTK